MIKNYVAYYRVSTKQQGKSGLGLEAQKTIINQYTSSNKDSKIIAEYTEIESGRKKDRKQLNLALEQCKAEKAILLIAKLDRLARNVSFIFSLREAGITFVACDLQDFNTLTLGIFASFAQFEAERISQRIKEALQATKARGTKLGRTSFPKLAGIKAVEAVRANSMEKDMQAYKLARMFQKENLSLNKIASKFNALDMKTKRGGRYTAKTIANMFRMFERAETAVK